MAMIPVYLLLWWFGSWLESLEKSGKETKCVAKRTKPKYRMKEVRPEDDELFMTDLGDFDEAFKL